MPSRLRVTTMNRRRLVSWPGAESASPPPVSARYRPRRAQRGARSSSKALEDRGDENARGRGRETAEGPRTETGDTAPHLKQHRLLQNFALG
ncbi:hypothetical protein EVAR_89298_1 [Eumeta japonica]|uniref:Uncharacterized protein n=1 Tax=Eumeta variegata TaxID=151549 RepID=A0A4C1SMJ2_EUMVA|nr:hypothetical protein EVAR_89298_1 [Eumeta japonica]